MGFFNQNMNSIKSEIQIKMRMHILDKGRSPKGK